MSDANHIPPPVLDAVRSCIAQSLALTEAQVTLHSRLIDDLGADSLDFVDIIFAIDSKFNIRVRDSEFNFLTRLDFSSPDVMKDGHLVPGVVARLESWLPELAAMPDKTTVTPRQLFSLITVEAICLVTARRVNLGA